MVRRIQDEPGATVEIEDDGTVHISSVDDEGMTRALNAIRALTDDVEFGKIYTGTVRRIVDFGAFVEILPGKEGLVRLPNSLTTASTGQRMSSPWATRSR